jgi:WD40 repeat protein
MSRSLFALLVATLPALAAPTPDRVKADLAKFRAEREAAAKQFPAAEMAAADQSAAKAAAALVGGNPVAAARLARDARWLLPARPSGLPPHVGRVIGTARLRHADRVNAVAYSPDGTKLASASRDGTVRVWDLGSGREVVAYRGHADPAGDKAEDANVLRAAGVAFSPDGKAVASSGGADVHLWNPATGDRIKLLPGHQGPVTSVAFGPDPNVLVSGSDDKTVIVWDVAAGKPAYTSPPQTQRVEAVAAAADGKRVASVNAAGELFVYAPADKKVLLTLPAPEPRQGLGVAFAGANGVVVAGADGKARLIAGPTADGTGPGAGTPLRTLLGHDGKINSLAVSPDGRWLVTGGGSGDRTVRVWDLASGKALWTFAGHAGADGVTAVAVRPDGAEAASGGDDGAIRLWPLAAADEHRAFPGAAGPVWGVAASPDGGRFAAAGADGKIRVHDAGSGKLVNTLDGHAGGVTAISFAGPDRLASVGGDKLVKVWTLADGTARDLPGHTSAGLAVAAADKLVASGAADKTVRGWDASTGKPLWTWDARSAVCGLAVRPDGKRVAVGTADGALTLLDVTVNPPNPSPAVSAHLAGVAGVAYSPDGRWVATCGGDGVARLWAAPDAGPPAAARRFEPPTPEGVSPASAVAFAADGRTIAVGGKDPTVRLWDARTGAEVRTLRGATDWVTAVAFRPDGQGLLAAGADRTVREFELARPESTVAAGHTQPVLGVAVSRDGKLLATASVDKTVKVWDLVGGREVGTLTGPNDRVSAVGFVGPNVVVGAGAGLPDHRVRWWTVSPPAEVRSQPTRGEAFNLAVAPDGSRVAVVWASGPADEKAVAFDVFPGDGDGPPARVTDSGREVRCAAISPDATLGVTGGTDGVVRVWDLAGKERRGGDWPLFVKPVVDLGLTADGKTLVGADADGAVKVADLAAREVTAAAQAAGGGRVAGLVVAPAGGRFATLADDGEVKAWDMSGKEVRAWKLPVAANAAAFTPDGKALVTGNKDGTAYVLELP